MVARITGISRWAGIGAIIVSLVIATFFILPRINVKIIEGDAPCEFPEHVCNFATALGFPTGWLRPDTFIWYAFLPLLGVTMVVYGFLTVINIFGRNRPGFYFLLAFLIAFSTIPMGLFVVFVSVIFAFIGTWSIIIFALMFGIGIVYYFVARTRSWRAGEFAKEAFDDERDKIEKNIEYGRKILEDTDKELKRIQKMPAGAQKTAMLSDVAMRRKQAQDIMKAGQESLKIVSQRQKDYLKRLKKLSK